MLAQVEDRLTDWLKKRQNARRYKTYEPTVQDCMDFLFVLANRLKKIERRLDAKSNPKRDA